MSAGAPAHPQPRWWRGYRRAWLTSDAAAALTLIAVAIPEQVATARLAGVGPIIGFYAFAAGSVMFALLGASRRMSVGADSTIAPLFAVAVAGLAPVGSHRYGEDLAILAVEVGALVALVGLLRLGWLAEFLSAPIVTGFLAGVAIIIAVHQLGDLLGTGSASGSTLHRLRVVGSHLGQTNGWALGIGLGVLALVLAAERIDRRVPGALLALVGATLLVSIAGLSAHGVATLGPIAHGAPQLGLPGLTGWRIIHLIPTAAVVALVVVTQTAATARAFPDTDPEAGALSAPGGAGATTEDVDRDLVGVAAGNLMAGLVGAFPVNASPPRTAVVTAAGGRTPAVSLIVAAGVIALVPAAGALRDVPPAALAGILLYVATRIFHGRELVAIARFDRFELGLALICLVAVALIGVEQGIGVAVGLAIVDRARLSARPQLHTLGRLPGTTSWAPAEGGGRPVSGVLVVLFATPLWYANATRFRLELVAALDHTPGPVRVVVLDALGMSDLDFTAARVLASALDELDRRHIAFAMARVGQHLRENLERAGLLERIGPDRLFPSVDEAVASTGDPVQTIV